MQMLKILCMTIAFFPIIGCDSSGTAKIGGNPQETKGTPLLSNPSHFLNLSLDSTFPKESMNATPLRTNFETVAGDVLQVMQDMFSGANLPDTRPIICSVTSEPVPWTNATSDPKIIRIYLSLPNESLQELDYNRFAYQLSHELAHVIMNARRTNGLIETLADAVSYQSLDDLAKLWLKKYSNHKPWRDFAPSFQRYRKVKVEQKWLLRLPREVQDAVHQGQWSDIASYLRQRQSELDTNPFNDTGYTLRSLGVMALRSDSLPWKDFAGIASLTNPSPSQDNRYRKDLSVDISRTSNEVQNALRRLGRK